MEVDVPPGKYVVAVSGGVDSMVLLDVLSKQKDIKLVVAHFNHGMRDDAFKDEKLVQKIVANKHLAVEVGHGNLGKDTSEDQARKARYKFLESVKTKYKANAIITAHHQDDLIETAFINILRGTGHRGLTSMIYNPNVYRPLLNYSKKEIIAYAKKHNLVWREDATNLELNYLRNYIRKYTTSGLDEKSRENILSSIEKVAKKTPELSGLLATISQKVKQDGHILRSRFTILPYEIGSELLVYWLHKHKIKDIDKKTIDRLNMAIRTAKPGTKHNVKSATTLVIEKRTAHFTNEK